MKLKLIFLIQFIYLKHVLPEKSKIAIIGSGIGGSSCAYFLKQNIGNAVNIDLYEGNKIGGRLATVEHFDTSYEIGGCVIHEANKYMNYFRNKFKLKKRVDDSDENLGIYDKNGFQFLSSNFKIITYAKILWRYGFSIYRLRSFIEDMLHKFDKIYDLQEKGKSFATVEELFAEADQSFLPYFNVTSKDGFSKFAKVNERTINDLVKGSLRVNYGQANNVHLFVGSVSVAGMFGDLWAVDGGNKKIPELLVQHSQVNFFKNYVYKIEFDKKHKKYVVQSLDNQTNQKLTITYDIVVLANPINSDSKTPIKFANFTKPILVQGKYQRTTATLISGHLNGSYYGLSKNNVPHTIIHNDETDIINSIGKIRPVTKVKKYDDDIWKIFSQQPLTADKLDRLFEKYEIINVKDWLAYPKYEKLGLSNEFILHDKLYYINAIEWAASAMEMSVIGAKNVALLIQKKLSSNEAESYKVKEDYKKVEL